MPSKIKIPENLVVLHVKQDSDNSFEVSTGDQRTKKPIAIRSMEEKQTIFVQEQLTSSFDEEEISIAVPNEIAMSLSTASRCIKSADALRKNIKTIIKENKKNFINSDLTIIYDYISLVQQGVVFAYRAIEAFSNTCIPDDYVYTKKTSKGTIESFNKDSIERWITTSVKIGEIIPAIMQTPSPKKEKFWPHFMELEKLRNDIIHTKSTTTQQTLSQLLSPHTPKIAQSSADLLAYFIKTDPHNPSFPLGFGESYIKLINLDSFKGKLEKAK
ncbi:hypothetical protein [Chitinimonas taiwanensis]|uniref:hypothetical protein n=1 Tax=Chitinimonas taiwanensis TaxID=240412 RepID=UPI0035B109A3